MKKTIYALLVFAAYVGLIYLSNYLMKSAEIQDSENLEMWSGIIFGFIAIPVFSIIIPLWLAEKWKLEFSFWPKGKSWINTVTVLLLYIIIANFLTFEKLLQSQIKLSDFLIHYLSSMMFHISYYPLFVVFLFPVFRRYSGTVIAIIATSFLFAVYHLAQYHFFEAGTSFYMQFFLFIAFTVNLLLYLWSESLILVSLVHSLNGAIGLAAKGTMFNEVDFVFYLAVLIIGGSFAYYIYREIKQRKNNEYLPEKWMNTQLN